MHVVMSKCDLLMPKELARRYTLLGSELRALQLQHLIAPHHMVSSKTDGGIELLRATLSSVLPPKLLRRASKETSKAGTDKAGADVERLSTVETPAARSFAEQLARNKRRDSERERERMLANMGREERGEVAHASWARRAKRRGPAPSSRSGARRGRRRG